MRNALAVLAALALQVGTYEGDPTITSNECAARSGVVQPLRVGDGWASFCFADGVLIARVLG